MKMQIEVTFEAECKHIAKDASGQWLCCDCSSCEMQTKTCCLQCEKLTGCTNACDLVGCAHNALSVRVSEVANHGA